MKLQDITKQKTVSKTAQALMKEIHEAFLMRLPQRYHHLVSPVGNFYRLTPAYCDFTIAGDMQHTAVKLLINTVTQLSGTEPEGRVPPEVPETEHETYGIHCLAWKMKIGPPVQGFAAKYFVNLTLCGDRSTEKTSMRIQVW